MPRSSPSFQWGAASKAKVLGSPQLRTVTLSPESFPTGTSGRGILGTCKSSSPSFSSLPLTSSSRPCISARRARPFSWAFSLSLEISLRCWRRPSSRPTLRRRSVSSCRTSSSMAVSSRRLVSACRTSSGSSLINLRSSIIFVYLTPSVPLSYQGEGEVLGRGAAPLLDIPFTVSPSAGGIKSPL